MEIIEGAASNEGTAIVHLQIKNMFKLEATSYGLRISSKWNRNAPKAIEDRTYYPMRR
jgi:hypothetical protein